MAALLQQGQTLVLEAAALQRVGREQQETVLMVERFAPARVPEIPAAQRLFGHRRVQLVAVVCAHHLADIG
jgi:hypothetical protein